MRSRVPIPGPLVAHLIEKGVLFADGLTRRARLHRCTRCGALVVRGLDDDRCAAEALADPWPLSVEGEVAALVEGLATFDLGHGHTGPVLSYRYAESIEGRPAGRVPRWDVLAEHRCGRGPQGVTTAHVPMYRRRQLTTTDDPPF